jgi:hypothetical protein
MTVICLSLPNTDLTQNNKFYVSGMIQQLHLTPIKLFTIDYILYGGQASCRGGKLNTYLQLDQKNEYSYIICSLYVPLKAWTRTTLPLPYTDLPYTSECDGKGTVTWRWPHSQFKSIPSTCLLRRGQGHLYLYLTLTYHIPQNVTVKEPLRDADHIHHLNHSQRVCIATISLPHTFHGVVLVQHLTKRG